jgi:thiol-disulfide isomerase/thioredoxin
MILLRSFLVTCLSAWLGLAVAAEAQPRSFKTGSLAQILAARQGKPFLLNLWSLTCPPCRSELDLFAKLRKQHPKFDVVLIAADDPEYAAEAQDYLVKRGLAGVESWIFAEADLQKLRYEIDAEWFGEMPRSYFYDAKHKRIPISGALKAEQLESWIKAVKQQ